MSTYKIVDMDMQLVSVDFDTSKAPSLILTNLDAYPINYADFGIYLTPVKELYASFNQRVSSFGLINSAYACKPPTPRTNDYITKIEIFANKDYDSLHTQGTNIAEYFDVIAPNPYGNGMLIKQDLQAFFKSKIIVPNEMTLTLNTPPEFNTDFVFTIIYGQNGVSLGNLTLVTNTVTINK
ncbi:MAG: hypothetical protein KAG64_06505 [Bacteroidales bacterium]|nr:hypothetical protein [Bacteroidales bacterium]